MTKGNWSGARESMQAALGNLRETGDLAGAVDAMTAMGVILIELGDMVQAAGYLREAITEARRIGYGQGEIYGAWTVAFLACRHGLNLDAATMDDALAEHIGLVERGLPRRIFLDYVKSIEGARAAAGLPTARHPDGRGWGWLRARALEIATEISTQVERVEPIPVQSVRHSRAAHRHELTARELQILSAIASGQTNAQIAAELFLSAKTVMHHSTSIYRKLAVGGRAEAVALAYRTGLLQTIAR